ncbi:hypothetical protein [Massilia aerilata]|uniref:Uncharacterized protein n=1 Tax=Massilia aerilata TaxID=453817 RepID=A0ABW0S6C8_9BURK
MSTNRITTICVIRGSRLRHAIWLLLAWAGLISSSAQAATQGETALANSPLPHERIGTSREPVKVHWVRLQGYFDGTKGHAAMLDELKADVQNCIHAAQLAGRETRPPQVWPDYVQSTQSDTYDAANRTITYATTLLYTYDHANCSLVENRRVTAKLASAKGVCDIDLANKTAHGVCDTRAHADTPAQTHIGPQAHAAGERAVSPNAQMRAALAAMEQAMKQYGPVKTGEHKTIAGIDCEVMTHVLGTDGTACISQSGSFAGWHAGTGSTGSGLELELSGVGGLNARATKAQLDAPVNTAVFAPYLASGFQVGNITKRK